jgi:hypothetical protein
MLALVFCALALSALRVESALFSSTEDLKLVSREHKRFIFDLSRLAKNMEHDLAYVKR